MAKSFPILMLFIFEGHGARLTKSQILTTLPCRARNRRSGCPTDRDSTRNILLFGGTFDPPTTAHAALAQHILENVDVDCVWFAPSYHPAYKTGKSDFGARLRMLRAAQEAGQLGPSDKICITSAFEDSYYSGQDLNDADSDALALLQSQFPKTTFDTSFGADTLTSQEYPMWNWAADYLKLIAKGGGRLIIVERGGVSAEKLNFAKAELRQKLADAGYHPLEFLSTPPLDGLSSVSSTRVRNVVCKSAGDFDTAVFEEMISAGILPAVADYLATDPDILSCYLAQCG